MFYVIIVKTRDSQSWKELTTSDVNELHRRHGVFVAKKLFKDGVFSEPSDRILAFPSRLDALEYISTMANSTDPLAWHQVEVDVREIGVAPDSHVFNPKRLSDG